jgi:hypothetical protein
MAVDSDTPEKPAGRFGSHYVILRAENPEYVLMHAGVQQQIFHKLLDFTTF